MNDEGFQKDGTDRNQQEHRDHDGQASRPPTTPPRAYGRDAPPPSATSPTGVGNNPAGATNTPLPPTTRFSKHSPSSGGGQQPGAYPAYGRATGQYPEWGRRLRQEERERQRRTMSGQPPDTVQQHHDPAAADMAAPSSAPELMTVPANSGAESSATIAVSSSPDDEERQTEERLPEERLPEERLPVTASLVIEGEGENPPVIADAVVVKSRRRRAFGIGILLVLLVGLGVGLGVGLSSNEETVYPPENGVEGEPTSSPSVSPNSFWNQLGQVIEGQEEDDRFGFSVSLSDDGKTVAIGAPSTPDNDANVDRPGFVQVLKYSSKAKSWETLGQTLSGEGAADGFGFSVSLSSNGTIVAIGAIQFNKELPGYVRVFEYDPLANNWTQRGPDIDGIKNADEFGQSVSLSSDGNILAVGASRPVEPGYVRVFRYVPPASRTQRGNWTQRGDDIVGDSKDDHFGGSISLSSDGSILAAGANQNVLKPGYVRVFQYLANWTQRGDDIKGDSVQDLFGGSVSLSRNGSVLAVGAAQNDIGPGYARVLRYRPRGNYWTQHGDDINGETKKDFFGASVSLSSDGGLLAVGSPNNDGNGFLSGYVRIHQYSSSTNGWNHQLGEEIDGEATGERAGVAVSLSSGGKIVAVGAPGGKGLVRIYGSRDYR